MPSLEYYLSLIPPEHADKPNYVQTVTLTVQPYVEMQKTLATLNQLFDLDVAVGQQLDVVGQWIGLTREVAIPLPNTWFSWATAGLGWGQGFWYQPFQPTTGIAVLDDMHYRILLKARVVANQWDGTVDGAYAAWNTLFAPEGLGILIQCGAPQNYPLFTWGKAGDGWGQAVWYSGQPIGLVNGDMEITMALMAPPNIEVDVVTKSLFEGGYLGLKGAGVRITNYALQTVRGGPLFAWGVGPAAGPAEYPAVPLAGWGIGGWPALTPGS